MALVLKELYKDYFLYVDDYRDKRIDHYPLLGRPWKIIAVLIFYWYFVKKLGPSLMERRQPYDLKNVMIVYNAVQVVLNLTLGIAGAYTFFVLYGDDDWSCIEIDWSDSSRGMITIRLCYCYFIIKIVDLTDTIFFILRKKYNQATFLHVYHHIVVCLGAYMATSYIPGGHSGILGMVNTFVHVIMYGYYLLTAFSDSIKKQLWWKKYITQIQIIQFAFLVWHYLRAIFHENCSYPFFWLIGIAIQNIFMLVLFSDFYIRAYIKKQKKA